jgi:hypothetical protein
MVFSRPRLESISCLVSCILMTTDHLKLTVADFVVLCYRDADLEYVSTENLSYVTYDYIKRIKLKDT